MVEYWYDPRHTGGLRIIDYNKNEIYGSEPSEPVWSVTFDCLDNNRLMVDFHNKKTHHGRKILRTTYEDRRMTLHWEDGNKWRRIKQDPCILLRKMKKIC